MTNAAWVQTLSEFAPILAFFIAGQVLPFSTAVLVLIISTIVSLIVSTLYLRQVPLMPMISSVIVTTAGILTILWDAPDAIIFADTIYYFGFSLAIIAGLWSQRQFLERMFDKTFAITQQGWRLLSLRWLVVLLLAGIANEYVRIFLTPEFWIDYRFTKVLLIICFALYQFRLARQYRIHEESNEWGLRTPTPFPSSSNPHSD